MATIDYKEKYEQAIEVAQRFYNNSVAITKKGLEDIFPELKESGDERIRKALIKLFKTENFNGYVTLDSIDIEDVLTWLEKQGEQKPADTEKGTNGNEREIPIPEPPLTIKHAKEVMGIKQDDAWSEEDEMRFNNIFTLLEELPLSQSWLKSLKDRVQPQNTRKPSDEHYELEEFAKIVRCNLTGISKAVQKLFEAKYLQLTGNKMYGGFKD